MDPGKEIVVGEYTCLVGANAEENWAILEKGKPGYLFFHLSSFPSCYVILQTEEKVVDDVIKECARICLENTKYKNLRKVYVDCTTISNVRKGEKVGEVEYTSRKKVKQIKLS